MVSNEFAIAPSARSDKFALSWPEYPLALGVLAVAALTRALLHLNCDTSWFLTTGEEMLKGARAYVDFIEINPPASLLLYLPSVLLGHLLGITDEAALTILVFAGALVSAGLSARIAAPLMDPRERPLFLSITLFVMLVLPAYTFAQRDHVALMASLPMLCVYTMHARRLRVSIWLRILAGIGAGITVSIKPFFALTFLLPLAAMLWKTRKRRPETLSLLFSIENIACGLVALIYGTIVVWMFPAFLSNTLPIVSALYGATPQDVFKTLVNRSVLLWAIGLTLLRIIYRTKSTDAEVFLLASAGFILCILLQGKGWPYHGYPAVALIMMLLGFALVRQFTSEHAAFARLHVAAVVVFAASCFVWFYEHHGFEDAKLIEQLAPSHPKLLAISPDLSAGHPIVRQIDGQWVGTTASIWISEYARRILFNPNSDPQTKATARKYVEMDRKLLVHDIVAKRPDIILVDGQGVLRWVTGNRDLATAMSSYRHAASVEDADGKSTYYIFQRKSDGQSGRRARKAAESVPSSR